MAISATNKQGYGRATKQAAFKVPANQPLLGNLAVTTGAEATFFQYDLITPWGLGQSVSNQAQTTRVMVGWNLTVAISLLTDQAMTLRIYIRGGATATFTEIDTSPMAIALSAKWRTITVGPLAAAHVRGTLQAGTNTTVEYHVRLIEP